jgi:ankyrin repeat protein
MGKMDEIQKEKNADLIRYIYNYYYCKESIDQGADVNHYTNQGYFPLYCASTFGLEETCQLLLENGANVNQTTVRVPDISRNTYQNDGISALWAAQSERIYMILLAAGANINLVNRHGNTVLDDSIFQFENPSKARFLIENGCDLNSTNPKKLDSTFANIVCHRKQYLYRIALEHGADPCTYIQKYRMTVLEYATLDGDKVMIELLIKYGAAR